MVINEKNHDTIYRKVQAMYFTDKTIDEIVRELRLPKMDVLDMMQTIQARHMMKKEYGRN